MRAAQRAAPHAEAALARPADCRACYLSRHRDHFAKTAPYHFLDFLSYGPPLVGEGLKTASEVRPARPRRVGVADATAPDVQRVLTEDYYCCTSIKN